MGFELREEKMTKRKLAIGLGTIGMALFCCFVMATAQSIGLIHPAPTPVITTPTIGPPTATPIPKPTPTPEPTLTPTPTLSPVAKLNIAITEALGSGKTVIDVSIGPEAEPNLFVQWVIEDLRNEDWTKEGAQMDVKTILEAVAKSGLTYSNLSVMGRFVTWDQYGNASLDMVILAVYTHATIDRINWKGFLSDNVYDIADDVWIHPAFRE